MPRTRRWRRNRRGRHEAARSLPMEACCERIPVPPAPVYRAAPLRSRSAASTAVLVGLDDDDHVGQRGDDAIAREEVPPDGRRAERMLGEQDAVASDAGPELRVAARVDDVETATHHGDGRRVDPRQRARMCGGVDAECQPRHDAHAGIGATRLPGSRRSRARLVVQSRVPTIATRGPSRALSVPCHTIRAGPCGSWRNNSGNSSSSRHATCTPPSTWRCQRRSRSSVAAARAQLAASAAGSLPITRAAGP